MNKLDMMVIGIFIGLAAGAAITWYFMDHSVRKARDSAARMRRDIEQSERVRQATRGSDEPLFVKPDDVKVMPDGLWGPLTAKERRFNASKFTDGMTER